MNDCRALAVITICMLSLCIPSLPVALTGFAVSAWVGYLSDGILDRISDAVSQK